MSLNDRLSTSTLLATAFAVLGGLAVAGGWSIPSARTVLFALGGIFLFAAASFLFLVSDAPGLESIYGGIYADLAANHAALVETYELQEAAVYVPTTTDVASEAEPPARLFVPRYADFDVPSDRKLGSLLVHSASDRGSGVSLRPSGSSLYTRFESMREDDVGETPTELAAQLGDGLVGLDLVRGVESTLERADNRISFSIRRSAIPFAEEFDHPLQSFLAVGLSAGLGRPVTAEMAELADNRYDYRVTCEWLARDAATERAEGPSSLSRPTDLSDHR